MRLSVSDTSTYEKQMCAEQSSQLKQKICGHYVYFLVFLNKKSIFKYFIAYMKSVSPT